VVIVLRYLPREGLFGLSVDLEEVSHACFKASGIVVFNQRNNIPRPCGKTSRGPAIRFVHRSTARRYIVTMRGAGCVSSCAMWFCHSEMTFPSLRLGLVSIKALEKL
jgi:hypothetical protein